MNDDHFLARAEEFQRRAHAAEARLADVDALNRHRERQIAAIVTWLEANQPDVFSRGLWEVIPNSADWSTT